MLNPQALSLRALALGVVLLASAGCSPTPDAGTAPDAGSTPDAGSGPDTVLRGLELPDSARRGPIRLLVEVEDPDGSLARLKLERLEGESWQEATVFSYEYENGQALWLWDSIADVPSDGPAELRVVAEDPEDGEVTLDISLELRNAPDTDRLVLVSHGSADDLSPGQDLSVFTWNGLEPGALGEPLRKVVGPKPGLLRAAPHGRAAAVELQGNRTLAIVRTPLDALPDEVELITTLTLPHGEAADFHWSADGRYLWVAGLFTTGKPSVLWRYEPSEDLEEWPEPVAVVELPGPPSNLAIADSSRELLVSCGSGGEGLSKVVLYAPDGSELGRYEADLMPSDGLAISPDGTRALRTESFDGPKIQLFSLEGGVSLLDTQTGLSNPYEVHFLPEKDSKVALVSQLDSNSVAPLTASGSTLSAGTPLRSLPLAAEMDLIKRGEQAGTFLIPVLSDPIVVRAVVLGADAAVTRLDTSVPLGQGYSAIPGGIAIQR